MTALIKTLKNVTTHACTTPDDEVTAAGGSNGIGEWEHVSGIFFQKVWAMWLAIRRWIAVGIPNGRSFVLSLGSLWRQKR